MSVKFSKPGLVAAALLATLISPAWVLAGGIGIGIGIGGGRIGGIVGGGGRSYSNNQSRNFRPGQRYPNQPQNQQPYQTQNQQQQWQPVPAKPQTVQTTPPTSQGNSKVVTSGTPNQNGQPAQQGKPAQGTPPSKSEFLSKIGAIHDPHAKPQPANPTKAGATTGAPQANPVGTIGGKTGAPASSSVISKVGANHGDPGNHKGVPSPNKPPLASKSRNNPNQDHHDQHHPHHNNFWLPLPVALAVASSTYCPVVISQPQPVFVPADASAPAVPVAPPLATTQPAANAAPATAPATTANNAPAPAPGVDLVLEEVQMVQPATASSGPTYRVKFRNDGNEAAGPFRVAAFAELDGSLTDNISRAVVECNGLAAHETGEVLLQLPLTAMKLVTSESGGPRPFTELSVSVDLDSTIAEGNKNNNVATVESAALQVAAN